VSGLRITALKTVNGMETTAQAHLSLWDNVDSYGMQTVCNSSNVHPVLLDARCV